MTRGSRAAIAVVGIVAAFACSGTDSPAGSPSSPSPGTGGASARLLIVTHTAGFRHGSIPIAEATLQEIGSASGLYQAEMCRTADDVRRLMTREALERYDAVFFANTTGNLGIPDLAAFLQWVADGHAFLGAHSATDTYHDSPEYIAMIGGEFSTHGSIVATDVRVDDASHPAVAHLAPRFNITDELYRFTGFNANVRRLLSLDRHPNDGVGDAGAPSDLPMAWHGTHGRGRVFYTAFGHRDEVWQDPRFRQHLREAIRWALQLGP
jgi:uncharacterized protein